MKLPNDLIKATDYSKAKEREIHMFEYVNGKYIQHYVLGGEHEMIPQEIVNCLNAIATLDCELALSYAFIKGQNEKIADLQHRLKVAEKATKMACKELYDSDSISICDYCTYNIQDKCPNECPQYTEELEKYFKEQAEKELKGE